MKAEGVRGASASRALNSEGFKRDQVLEARLLGE